MLWDRLVLLMLDDGLVQLGILLGWGLMDGSVLMEALVVAMEEEGRGTSLEAAADQPASTVYAVSSRELWVALSMPTGCPGCLWLLPLLPLLCWDCLVSMGMEAASIWGVSMAMASASVPVGCSFFSATGAVETVDCCVC
jgi:hypothetical protein